MKRISSHFFILNPRDVLVCFLGCLEDTVNSNFNEFCGTSICILIDTDHGGMTVF